MKLPRHSYSATSRLSKNSNVLYGSKSAIFQPPAKFAIGGCKGGMKPLTLQICGTGSGVGKSLLVAAFCRILLREGRRVCPFKAQNMSLNSFVTKEGGEIGRAQAVQAAACRITPSIDMNPILIKPTGEKNAQIILQGKPYKNMSATAYHAYKKTALRKVVESFNRLKRQHDVLLIEGAGSPAEINLKDADIANMAMAEIADAAVLLVGNIDQGGVFASFVGTLALLDKKERRRVKGFIINKFRGDKALLDSGIRKLEKMTHKPVLGVIPYFRDIKIPEEDSMGLPRTAGTPQQSVEDKKRIDIAVIELSRMSNFTDFDALAAEPDVSLHYVRTPDELGRPDILILPGTKNTIGDLKILRSCGLEQAIKACLKQQPQVTLIGLCGGFQMLGKEILDPHGLESKESKIEGFGLLPVVTTMEKDKILTLVKAKAVPGGEEISGYEIHHGRTAALKKCDAAFEITERHGRKVRIPDGAATPDGHVWGTYIHGVFDSGLFRRHFLNGVRQRKKWPPIEEPASFDVHAELDKLADLIQKNINMELFYKILTKNV